MDTKQSRPDRRALEILRLLQEQEQTDIAILFGSRANGTYEDGKSDIDIMLVQEQPPTPEQKKRTLDSAQLLAAERYRERTPIQVLWQTHQNFGRMRRTINHIVASATREGIILARDEQDYSRRYEGEPDGSEYEWTITDQRVRNAETHLYGLEVIHLAGGNDRLEGKNIQEAMEHALKAVISAAGARYPRTHDVAELTEIANRECPSLDFESSIPARIVNQYAGSDDYYDPELPVSGVEDYFDLATGDIRYLIDKAKELLESQRAKNGDCPSRS